MLELRITSAEIDRQEQKEKKVGKRDRRRKKEKNKKKGRGKSKETRTFKQQRRQQLSHAFRIFCLDLSILVIEERRFFRVQEERARQLTLKVEEELFDVRDRRDYSVEDKAKLLLLFFGLY